MDVKRFKFYFFTKTRFNVLKKLPTLIIILGN